MRVLVTGSAGMLGKDLCPALEADGHDCLRVSHSNRPNYLQCDLTDADDVQSVFRRANADCVVHSAAWTDVDGCQRDRDRAILQNGTATANVAEYCKIAGIPLLAVSTDYVFDGTKTSPYLVSDSTNPLNYYGESKLLGEEHIRSQVQKHFILRTSWLYGVHGKCFPDTMLRLSESRDSLNVVADQFGSPTHTIDLAKAISWLITTNDYGTYHFSNSGSCSWYEFAIKVFELSDKSDFQVNPIPAAAYPTPTTRPGYSVLDCSALTAAGYSAISKWDIALAEYLEMRQRR